MTAKLLTLLFISMMTVMAGATISPALPQIEAFFETTNNAPFWVKLMLTIPALFTAIGAPFVGVIIDRFGRKPLLLGATVLYGFAGGSGLLLNSLPGLLVGRALLGLSVAAIMTIATTLIGDYYQGAKRNQVMGTQAAFVGYGGVVFLVLGGVLSDVSWRLPFAIYLAAWPLAILVFLFIDEPIRESVAQATSAQAASTELSREAQVEDVLQNPKNSPKLAMSGIYALTFISMVAFYLVPVQLPFYLATVAQVSNTQVGIAIATMTLTSAIVSLFYPRIKAHMTFLGVSVLIYLAMGSGYVLIGLAQNYWGVLMGLITAGIGLGMLMPNINVWINALATPATRGRALGGLTTSLFLGQFFSPIVSQPITVIIGLDRVYYWFGIGMIAIAGGLLAIARKSRPVITP
jgi:MFS family permease